MKWITKDKKEIETSDMDDNHAKNTIEMLIRANSPQLILECILKGRYSLIFGNLEIKESNIKKSFELNGDMAQQFNDQQIEQFLEFDRDCCNIHDCYCGHYDS